MDKIIGTVFLLAFILCGCSINTVCDDWRSSVIFAIGFIVCVATAAAITRGDK